MSRMDSGTTIRTAKPTPNVYSVLAIVATLALAVGVGFLWHANVQQTQFAQLGQLKGQDTGMNPFFLIEHE